MYTDRVTIYRACTACILFLAFVFPAHATPEKSSPEWVRPKTAPDALTPAQIDQVIGRYWVQAGDEPSAYQALDYISSLLDSGSAAGEKSGVMSILARLASMGTTDVVRSANSTVNDFPLVRARAMQLLGRIGGAEALTIVLSGCRTDPSPDVRAAAVTALAAIDPRPSEMDVAAVRTVLMDNLRNWNNERLAYSALRTLQIFYLNSRRPEAPGMRSPLTVSPQLNDPELFRAIADVAFGPYSQQVRDLAQAVLNAIRNADGL